MPLTFFKFVWVCGILTFCLFLYSNFRTSQGSKPISRRENMNVSTCILKYKKGVFLIFEYDLWTAIFDTIFEAREIVLKYEQIKGLFEATTILHDEVHASV